MLLRNKEVIEYFGNITQYAAFESKMNKSFTDIIASFCILQNHNNLKNAYSNYYTALEKLENEYNVKSDDNGKFIDMTEDKDDSLTVPFSERMKKFLKELTNLLNIKVDVNIKKINADSFKNEPPAGALLLLSFMIEQEENKDESKNFN